MVAIFGLATACTPRGQTKDTQKTVRPAGVAGSFYPAEKAALTGMIDDMLAQVVLPQIDGHILAVVAPHAGYPYSGPVAAYSYGALKGQNVSRVVVIAPSHFEGFGFASVFEGHGYETPLGTVLVDKDFALKLSKRDRSIRLSSHGHVATASGAEHALEVQLPWLQRVLGSFTLVPVVMGNQSYESSRALGIALAGLIEDEKEAAGKNQSPPHGDTLIVASSDMSHYHTYGEANRIDHKTLDAIQTWDYLNMSRNFERRVWEACGGGPIVAAMIAAERLGANKVQVLKYANSGDTSGDRSRVVGYGSEIFVKAPSAKSAQDAFTLNKREKEDLIALAHKSVERAVRDRKPYEPAVTGDERLGADRGAFVTLQEEGHLRGCIGFTSPTQPLYLTVRDAAMYAAMKDPRFQPVAPSELKQLEYEISVLSPMRRVQNVHEIKIGEHGLLIKNGRYEGLLLPQVAVEQHWNAERFLQETCAKAGMSPDCWNDPGTDIFGFNAVVFGEHQATK